MSNSALTLAYIEHWNRMDIEAIVADADENILYHNIPMDPVIGKVAFRATISPLLRMATHTNWETPLIAETASGEVLTERVDTFVLATGGEVTIRVMGVFEWTATGKLAKWRDYFDLAEFQSQMPG
ncbi:MAG: limonene-1,2-epoxide hydrolase family protein [Pseudomonadota bacterium]